MNIATNLVETAVSPFTKYVKIVFMTIIVMSLVGLLGIVWYLGKELEVMTAKNGELTETNRTLSQDLELVRVGQTAMNMGQLLSDQQKEDMDKQARATRNKLKARETEIDKTVKDPEEKARLKSEARMDSVWELYCHIQPSNAICKQRSPAAQAGSQDKETPPAGASK